MLGMQQVAAMGSGRRQRETGGQKCKDRLQGRAGQEGKEASSGKEDGQGAQSVRTHRCVAARFGPAGAAGTPS